MTTFQLNPNNAPQINSEFEIETITQINGIAYVSDSSGKIGQLDTDTRQVSNIVATQIIFTDIAVNQAGELYGSTFSTLYKINPETGSTEKIGHFCQSGINGLGFTSDGDLYASSNSGGVFTVNSETGLATIIRGTESFKSGGDIAFDETRNQFFGVDTSGKVYSISLGGELNLIGDTHFDHVFGLYMEGGNLYAQTQNKQQLLIDQTNGSATVLGNIEGGINLIYGSTQEAVQTQTNVGILSVAEGTTAIADINATDDQDAEGTGLSYRILGGNDSTLFEIDSRTGQLTFKNAPDFETPLDTGADNQYELEIGVTDSQGLSNSQVLWVRVTDVNENEAPMICEPGHEPEAYVKIRENQTFVTDFLAIDDSDYEGAGLTYSIVGGADANAFVIDAATGILTFKTAPDYEAPTDSGANGATPNDNIYGVQVAVTDSEGLSTTQTLTVEVANINDVPKNVILGNNQNNLINGTASGDDINGLSGNDTLYGREGHDCVQGGEGNDFVGGNQGNDTLLGGTGNDTLQGHGDSDRLVGGAGNDSLNGGTDNDVLNGSINFVSGANELDTLTGGTGDDRFILGSESQAYYIAAGEGDFATITDFKVGNDIVQLHGSTDDYSVQIIDGNSHLFYGNNRELIAVFEGIEGLDLHGDCFQYTDPVEVLSVNDSQVNEGDNAIFTVELSHASTSKSAVQLDLSNGTATLGEDIAEAISVSFDGGETWKKTHRGQVTVEAGQSSFQVRVKTNEDTLHESDETFTLKASTDLSSANGTGTILNDDQLRATLVGNTSIHEGSSGFYRIDLENPSAVDQLFDIQINDGSAHRLDADGSNQDIIWGGYYDTRNIYTGEIIRIVENRIPNGTATSLGDRPATGPGDASWDFTAYQDGSINHGNTITVKIEAGQTRSNEFEIKAWKETVTVDRDVQFATHREGTENFNIQVFNESGVEFVQDSFSVDIVDQTSYSYVSPISIDLNGDGLKTLSIDQGIKFDILNSGERINTGWISGEDGFLAVDDNGNGQIDSIAELFGGGVGDGFAKLGTFDSNQDGVVNASDMGFDQLRIWQDANENGFTDKGELVSLEQAGILGLSTSYQSTFNGDEHGNVLGEKGTAIAANGQTLDMIDVYFKTAAPV